MRHVLFSPATTTQRVSLSVIPEYTRWAPPCLDQHSFAVANACPVTDRTTPHTLRRWAATAVLVVLFFVRILTVQAYFIVCYALG